MSWVTQRAGLLSALGATGAASLETGWVVGSACFAASIVGAVLARLGALAGGGSVAATSSFLPQAVSARASRVATSRDLFMVRYFLVWFG